MRKTTETFSDLLYYETYISQILHGELSCLLCMYVFLLGQRDIPWPGSNSPSVHRLLFVGILIQMQAPNAVSMLGQRDAASTLKQHWVSVPCSLGYAILTGY